MSAGWIGPCEAFIRDSVEEVLQSRYFHCDPTAEPYGVHTFVWMPLGRDEARLDIELIWPGGFSAGGVVIMKPVEQYSLYDLFTGLSHQEVLNQTGNLQFPNLRAALVYLRLKLARN